MINLVKRVRLNGKKWIYFLSSSIGIMKDHFYFAVENHNLIEINDKILVFSYDNNSEIVIMLAVFFCYLIIQ